MKTFVLVLLAALAGGVLGGAIIWVFVKTTSPAAIVLSEPQKPAVQKKETVVEPSSQPFARDEPSAPAVAITEPASNQTSSRLIQTSPQTSDVDARRSANTAPVNTGPLVVNLANQQAVALIHQTQSIAAPAFSPTQNQSVVPTNERLSDALSFALEAATPYVKEGFTVREDYWGGDLGVKQQKAIVHQLFKGNEYWFWMGTDVDNAKISVHIYDANGNLAEVEHWQKQRMAAARVVPKSTGSYYLIVEIEKSDRERTHWALAYGFR